MNVQKLKKFRENTAGLESRNPEIISIHCDSKVWKLGRKYTVELLVFLLLDRNKIKTFKCSE